MGHRLLHVDVLAALDGRHGDHGMGMVGRGHDHRVDVLLLVQHDAEILVPLGRAGYLSKVLAAYAGIDVAQGHDVLGRALRRGYGPPCRRCRRPRCSVSRSARSFGPPRTCRGTMEKTAAAPAAAHKHPTGRTESPARASDGRVMKWLLIRALIRKRSSRVPCRT